MLWWLTNFQVIFPAHCMQLFTCKWHYLPLVHMVKFTNDQYEIIIFSLSTAQIVFEACFTHIWNKNRKATKNWVCDMVKTCSTICEFLQANWSLAPWTGGLYCLALLSTIYSAVAGNRKSLGEPMERGVDMRGKLLQLYHDHYRAGRMKLVLLGGGAW